MPNAKRPAVADWPNAATTDLEQIDVWWNKADYNLALVVDRAGLAVVDLDGGKGISSWNNLAAREGAAWLVAGDTPLPTYAVKTPSGGYHLYFDGAFRTTQGPLAPHVDTRGPGSYVLAPPSHATEEAGERCTGDYTLVDGQEPVSVPEWLSIALIPRHAPQVGAGVARLDLDTNAAIGRAMAHIQNTPIPEEGSRDTDTYKLAADLGDLGISEETAIELMEGWINETAAEDFDALIPIASAFEHRQNDLGVHAVDAPSVSLAGRVERIADGADGGSPETRSRFYLKTRREQLDTPDPTWQIPLILPDRCTALMVAPPGGGKTWAALDLGLCVATGLPWAGLKPERPGPVVYAGAEGMAGIEKRRVTAWELANGREVGSTDFFTCPVPLLIMPGEVEEWWQAIRDKLGNRLPVLIILDTVASALSGFDEDVRGAGMFTRFVNNTQRQFDCAFLGLHHMGKDVTRGARGSNAFLANFDTQIRTDYIDDGHALSVWVHRHRDYDRPRGRHY